MIIICRRLTSPNTFYIVLSQLHSIGVVIKPLLQKVKHRQATVWKTDIDVFIRLGKTIKTRFLRNKDSQRIQSLRFGFHRYPSLRAAKELPGFKRIQIREMPHH